MKVAYLLMVLFTSEDGSEDIRAVSGVHHTTLLSCKVEQAYYQEESNIKFFCKKEGEKWL